MIDLSIIIVNYNSKNYLRGCLDSILNQNHKVSIEIFISDNNSSDGSIDMIKSDFPQVTLIENKDNIGYSAAVNRAIRQSSGRYFLILNNDIEVLNDSLALMVEIMDNKPIIGLLGCRLLNNDLTLQQSFGYYKLGFLSESVQKFIFNRYRNGNRLVGRYLERTHEKFRDVDWISGACIMARRKALEDVNLMDENYFMYFEEVDLCYRTKKKGWKICYTPEAKMIHYGGKSTGANYDKSMIEYRKSQLYFYKKHYGVRYMKLLKLYLLFKFLFHYINGYLVRLIFKDKQKTHREETELSIKLLSVIWRYQ